MALVVPEVLDPGCETRRAIERLSSKWTILVVYALMAGPQRPAHLRRRIPDVTQKMLTQTLRSMETDGLITRTVIEATAPGHVEYALTDVGESLRPALAAICDWQAQTTMDGHRAATVHREDI